MSRSVPWPPRVGEMLPRGTQPVGVRHKLATYVLNGGHRDGGPKARGFEQILGITIESVHYLKSEITAGILHAPVIAVRHNPPYGVNCVVDLAVRGMGPKRECVANVRTVWEFADRGSAPRLVSAYIKV
jgi:hypothetical protein